MVIKSNHTKCEPWSNQKCMNQATLINLHCNEYSQKCYYYPFAVKVDRGVGIYNTLTNLPTKVYLPIKT